MDKAIELKNKLGVVMKANVDLRERVRSERWSISYSGRTDMVLMGTEFPKGSFYLPIEDGVMLRIDNKNKIYGFAIENAKYFIKKNPEFGFTLSFIVYPIRSKIVASLFHIAWKIGNIAKEKQIEAVTSYVTSRAVFA